MMMMMMIITIIIILCISFKYVKPYNLNLWSLISQERITYITYSTY